MPHSLRSNFIRSLSRMACLSQRVRGTHLHHFVSVGASGSISTAPDGVNWTAQSGGTTLDLYGLAFGGGRFVAVGAASGEVQGSIILSSEDGVEWARHSCNVDQSLRNIAYGNNSFVIVGDPGVLIQSGTLPGLAGSVSLVEARIVGNEFRFNVRADAGSNYAVQISARVDPDRLRVWAWSIRRRDSIEFRNSIREKAKG